MPLNGNFTLTFFYLVESTCLPNAFENQFPFSFLITCSNKLIPQTLTHTPKASAYRMTSICKPLAYLAWNTHNSAKDLNTLNTLFGKCICHASYYLRITFNCLQSENNLCALHEMCMTTAITPNICLVAHNNIYSNSSNWNKFTNYSILNSFMVQWELNGSQYCHRNINWCGDENIRLPSSTFQMAQPKLVTHLENPNE